MSQNIILSQVFEKINDYLKKETLIDYKAPFELNDAISFAIAEKGVGEHEFLELIDKYLDYSVNTNHPQFLNQLYSGFNFPAFIGEIFTALANTSMYTYEVAPVATLIETEMIQLMNNYAGYTNGDGIFVSGGSNANLVAMFSARNQIAPESRHKGYDKNLKLRAFVNEHAHYSFANAANVIGIGTESLIKIKADENGRMIPEELEKEIIASKKRGETPFFVGVTCATTLLGAYDPIDEMAEICQRYHLWLHADGSFGGSLILSNKHRHLLNGIEKTDSFAWNPHKLMNIPLICSALLVKTKGTLHHNIADVDADYLFHDLNMVEDLGKKSIQCGRRVDAVKLWFAWKYFGKEGYEKRIDNLIRLAQLAEQKVLNRTNLELLAPCQSFTVCFRYVPEMETDLNLFNLQLREELRKTGKSLVNYGYIGDVLSLRLVITNGEMHENDVTLFFENLLETAAILEKNLVLEYKKN
jgi:glutamate/tyrosine decarboxylase-like PLP-dependent enzyme